MQNWAEPQSLQPEKQEKVQSETALFFMLKAQVILIRKPEWMGVASLD
jgi:hypothetical protein